MLTVICPHCHALYFDYKKLTFSRVNYPKFGMCYLQGQIQLPSLQPLTGILHNYLTGDDYLSREFHNNIQQYNAVFAMTSVEVKIDNLVTRQLGPYCFKIQGELHLTGTLFSHGDQTLMYVRIYILDIAEQLNVRRANNNNLDPVVIDNLQKMLLDNHPYIGHYRYVYELIREKPIKKQEEITIRLHMNLQQDQRTHNLPTTEEIVFIIPEDRVYHALDNRVWYYRLEEDNLNRSARTVLHILLFIMFCCFQKEKIGGIQEFQSVVLNLKNKGKIQGKEMERNMLAHRWCLIHATMSIVFMLEMVLSHLSSMMESCSSSLWLMHRQIVSRGNSTGLGHINILLDLSSTRDFRMLLCMIGIMEKMLGLWNANSFFLLLM